MLVSLWFWLPSACAVWCRGGSRYFEGLYVLYWHSRGPYMLYWHSRGPYVLYCHSLPWMFFWNSWIWSKNRVSEWFFPDWGHHPSKTPKTSGKHTNFLKRFQCISLRLEVYGGIKRSLTFVGVLASPRTKNKYLLASGPDLGFALLPWNLLDY